MITWGDVESVFKRGECPADCQYLRRWAEYYPYGETEVAEQFIECALFAAPVSSVGPLPSDCPVTSQ